VRDSRPRSPAIRCRSRLRLGMAPPRAYLAEHPMCSYPGCTRAATDVDHKIPRRTGGTDAWSNLAAYCHQHYSELTARFDGGFGNVRRRDKPGGAIAG
jgi:5-methylcytosine-specific restriction endonuclease McrA